MLLDDALKAFKDAAKEQIKPDWIDQLVGRQSLYSRDQVDWDNLRSTFTNLYAVAEGKQTVRLKSTLSSPLSEIRLGPTEDELAKASKSLSFRPLQVEHLIADADTLLERAAGEWNEYRDKAKEALDLAL